VTSGRKWDYLLTLTGPVSPQEVITIKLESDDPQTAHIDALHVFNQVPSGQLSAGSTVNDPTSCSGVGRKIVTITTTGRRVSKTAKLDVDSLG
jgi:hypothetical protein